MADNVTIANGAGGGASFLTATDEVGVNGGTVAHVQWVKLVDGTANGTDGIPGTAARGLLVDDGAAPFKVEAAITAVTTATTAYTAGDQVGPITTIANAARSSGGSGYIVGVQIIDQSDIAGAYDVIFFNASVTLAGDNAAYAISDADSLKVIDVVQLAGAFDIGNNRVIRSGTIRVPYVTVAGTSIYASLVTRAGHGFFTAGATPQLNVYLERKS